MLHAVRVWLTSIAWSESASLDKEAHQSGFARRYYALLLSFLYHVDGNAILHTARVWNSYKYWGVRKSFTPQNYV